MGIGERYAVLAFDARGHGESGGLIGIDGPREVADVRAVFSWLRDRPDVADARIGGWGVSYGGGAAWNSLAAGRAVGGARDLDLVDRPPHGARPAGAREDRCHRRVHRRPRPEARRPGGVRDPRRRLPRRHGARPAVRSGALLDLRAEERANAGLPHAGAPRLRVRARPGEARLRRAPRPEAALDRAARARAVVRRRGGHARDARRGRAVVRPVPARRHGPRAPTAGRDRTRALARRAAPVRRAAEGRHALVRAHGTRRGDCPGRPLPAPGPRAARAPRGVRLARRRGHGRRVGRLVANRRRAQRPDALRHRDRRGRGRRPHARRAADVPHRPLRPGDVRSAGLAPHGDDRLVVARPEPRQPPLPRPAVRVERAPPRDGRVGEDPRARHRRSRDEAARPPRGRRAHRGDGRRSRRTCRARPVRDDDPDRRHRPPLRRGGRVRHRRPRREGVLRVRQLEGRRERPEDRVPLLRRRVQPGADGAAHAPARRAGQGVRDLQRDRHREQPRDPRLPERPEGAPPLRRRRVAGARRRLGPLPLDGRLPPELPGRGLGARARRRPDGAARADRRPLREHRARQGHDPRPLARPRRQEPEGRRRPRPTS